MSRHCQVRACDWADATQWVIDNALPGAILVEGWKDALEKWNASTAYRGEELRTFFYGHILTPDQQMIFKLMFATR